MGKKKLNITCWPEFGFCEIQSFKYLFYLIIMPDLVRFAVLRFNHFKPKPYNFVTEILISILRWAYMQSNLLYNSVINVSLFNRKHLACLQEKETWVGLYCFYTDF